MRDTDLTRQFYGSDYAASELTPEQVQNIADMTNIQQDDWADLTLAREIVVNIEPKADAEHFKGQIWLLVGPQVYSSAESFAVFCKQTGFATLVGQPTGGSNSGGCVGGKPEQHCHGGPVNGYHAGIGKKRAFVVAEQPDNQL